MSEGPMAQGAEDVPVVYLHEIKRQYVQGETTLTILDGATSATDCPAHSASLAPLRMVSVVAPWVYCRFISWR